MQQDRSSRTAAYIAALRGLGVLLPPRARLVDDPFGAAWTGVLPLRRLALAVPGLANGLSRPLWRWLLYTQVRTLALDLEVERFARAGGRQLMLLGAGLDARALRLRRLGLRVFEIDHPATQSTKRALAGDDAATFVAFDFEHEPLDQLPERLCGLGYQRFEPGCVVLEGVTMYLSKGANAALFEVMADLLAPGSVIAFTYFETSLLASPDRRDRRMRRAVARRGEPWVCGWEPAELPAWLARYGFSLEHDDPATVLAARWLPAEFAARVKDDRRRIALARRTRPEPPAT